MNKFNNTKVLQAMKRAFRELRNYEGFKQVFMSKNGNYVLTNRYFIVDYGNNENVVPNALKPYTNLKPLDCAFNYENMKNDNIKSKAIIKVEDLEKLKKYNKTVETKLPYVINNNVLINTQYMLDILILSGFKGDKFEIEYGEDNAPINIKINNINSILLPIKPTDEVKLKFIKKTKEVLEENK